jgi:ABC-type proline/glycine betaine transport system ATPase subunit
MCWSTTALNWCSVQPRADAATLRRLRLRHVAMVFQQFGLLPWRSVRENVGLGLELAGLPRRDRRDRVDPKSWIWWV